MKSNSIAICLIQLLLTTQLSVAQEKQGNIVEYFGKEKVEDIGEGEVMHLFKEGLILKRNGNAFGSGTIPKNSVFARVLQEGSTGISEGKHEETDQVGNKLIWEKIETGEKNDFQDSKIRNGYLYLVYQAQHEETVLFDASGHTNVLINSLPHEGDYYDYGWSMIPIRLKKGKNEFLLKGGRFPNIRARLLKPTKPVQFTKRDMTLPDLIIEEKSPLFAAVRVINANNSWFRGGTITCQIGDMKIKTNIPAVTPMTTRKVGFSIPTPAGLTTEEKLKSVIYLKNKAGKTLSSDTLELNVKSKYKHHKRTFISEIDGSVQYYSIAPSSDPGIEKPALFLSVHGASVEAVNQANAYSQKDWGHLVAPTNRRPFGFAWEDWGRLDALEVLSHAEGLLKTDPQRTYLTGHSMGGHGTWHLGVTYPDRFAAIAPCAGYADLHGYRQSFLKRLKNMSDEEARKRGINKAQLLKNIEASKLTGKPEILMDSLLKRAGNQGRTLKLKNNYQHHGVFILHGEKDNVVPVSLAREMRQELGKFHPDFSYYEYPDGTHWYGNHSVDWGPLFDFFKARTIKNPGEIKNIEFNTASPGISPGSHFVKIIQQKIPLEISTFNFKREGGLNLTTKNAQRIAIDIDKMAGASDTISIDGQEITLPARKGVLHLSQINEQWVITDPVSLKEKGPHRNGGIKDAFRNRVVLVYATKGSKKENEWYYNRAKYDAEKFWYLGNGSFEIIKDTEFSLSTYKDRNVVVYGNRDNNAAWKTLLKSCPIQVSDNELSVGSRSLKGEQWGTFFIYPRHDSDIASIGVVSATGEKGMKAAYANDYLGRVAFPDIIIFDENMTKTGISGIKCGGFFGNDWSVDNGDILWNDLH
ncbi:prolyl oligopeptidase family serine peptidase [Fulvivirgaceae bacterium BMA12]|uniref:Prolyl oligopeptidase family serine peptidase n=1 Tax=Agaribacillus aureus TaxID=3051825 RepID=A0ABT8LD15_9BACT|nr:prolyl oligopeptidase family serine peptidase [Fulvivirgaceae bacterium BMA12]